MNQATVKNAARKAAQGIGIVRSSRVSTGTVSRNVELDDDSLGFIVSDELNPAKARILLMLALSIPYAPPHIQQLFYTY